MTNEIIGLVLVVAAIVVVLVVRHLLTSRRSQGLHRVATHEAGLPETGVSHDQPETSVTSAFGPAPVWAGGSPGSFPQGWSDGKQQKPPEPVLPSASRPAPSATVVVQPPPVTFPLPTVAVGGPHPGPERVPAPEREPDPDPEPDPVPLPGQDRDPAQQARVKDQTHDEPLPVEVLTAPGNSAYPSKVMHVSNICAQAAQEIPTAWVVVTPMDLLGDPPSQPHSREHVADSETEAVVPAPAPTTVPVVATTPEPNQAPELGRREVARQEEPIRLTPNPFGPNRVESTEVDLGMPSGLLADLLGPDEPVGGHRPRS